MTMKEAFPVTFYKNGQRHFPPQRVVVSSKKYRTWDALLEELSKRLQQDGGVQRVFDLSSKQQVREITSLQEGGQYVCTGSERLRNLAYGEKRQKKKKQQLSAQQQPLSSSEGSGKAAAAARTSNHLRLPELSPRQQFQESPKANIVTVYLNAAVGDKPRKFVVHPRSCRTLETVVESLSNMFKVPGGIQRIYSLDGRRVKELPVLYEEQRFVVTGSERLDKEWLAALVDRLNGQDTSTASHADGDPFTKLDPNSKSFPGAYAQQRPHHLRAPTVTTTGAVGSYSQVFHGRRSSQADPALNTRLALPPVGVRDADGEGATDRSHHDSSDSDNASAPVSHVQQQRRQISQNVRRHMSKHVKDSDSVIKQFETEQDSLKRKLDLERERQRHKFAEKLARNKMVPSAAAADAASSDIHEHPDAHTNVPVAEASSAATDGHVEADPTAEQQAAEPAAPLLPEEYVPVPPSKTFVLTKYIDAWQSVAATRKTYTRVHHFAAAMIQAWFRDQRKQCHAVVSSKGDSGDQGQPQQRSASEPSGEAGKDVAKDCTAQVKSQAQLSSLQEKEEPAEDLSSKQEPIKDSVEVQSKSAEAQSPETNPDASGQEAEAHDVQPNSAISSDGQDQPLKIAELRPRTPEFFRNAHEALVRQSESHISIVTPNLSITESMLDLLQDRAATTIQAYTRGYLARKRYRDLLSQKRAEQARAAAGQQTDGTGIVSDLVQHPAVKVETLPRTRKRRQSTLANVPPRTNNFKPSLLSKYGIVDRAFVRHRYHWDRKLGDGNFARVYLATGNVTGEEFAIKIIDKRQVQGAKEKDMLKNEVNIMMALEHPNCLHLVDVFETGSELYLVLEYASGGDLFDKILSIKRFNELECARLVRGLVSAVRYLHDQSIIHRDLKPENLLLSRDNKGNDVIKLADFGLSMVVQDKLHTICGTPTYVAPEIIKDGSPGYGLAVDMWAIGVITYIMLCGFPPFASPTKNQKDLFRRICSGKFSFPEPYWSDISAEAKDFISALLVVDVRKRMTAQKAEKHVWLTREGLPPLPPSRSATLIETPLTSFVEKA